MRLLFTLSPVALALLMANPAQAQDLKITPEAMQKLGKLPLLPQGPKVIFVSPSASQLYNPGSTVVYKASMVTEAAPYNPNALPWKCCEVQGGNFDNGAWSEGGLQIWDDLISGHNKAWADFANKGKKRVRARAYKTNGERGSWSAYAEYTVLDNLPPPVALALTLSSPAANAVFGPGSTVHYQASISPANYLQNSGFVCCEVQGASFKNGAWVSSPSVQWNDLLTGRNKTWDSFAEKGQKKIKIRLYKVNGGPNGATAYSPWSPEVAYTVSPDAGGQPGGGQPGGGGGGGQPAITGNITQLSVPGGSFAEDETQKLLVNGSGGCLMDLNIHSTSADNNFNQTWPVGPVPLGGAGASLYNGTHFATLAQGSYSAKVVGKNGCTGQASIDFKVTEPSATQHYPGKINLSLQDPPKSGGVYSKTKDSNIWFVVSGVPNSLKAVPYITCCDVEFNFKNQYGAWEVYGNGPFSDNSWANVMGNLSSVAVYRSISFFSQGSEWRMRVRPYKYKATFDWSDWLEFKTSQN